MIAKAQRVSISATYNGNAYMAFSVLLHFFEGDLETGKTTKEQLTFKWGIGASKILQIGGRGEKKNCQVWVAKSYCRGNMNDQSQIEIVANLWP